MRLVNHERDAMDLRAAPVEGFTWAPEVLQAHSAPAITAVLGTDHRPRTGRVSTLSPEEAP
ncbi:hypothetical protein [Actinomadura hibisca]|uniref:hypothetical protein n=1 Tax=Actinomadura hibisca TaxID=68565 RepID=UPI0008307868|nr:hypothetical protein [Actinomadura hibisca]